jgi:hypothetical protein
MMIMYDVNQTIRSTAVCINLQIRIFSSVNKIAVPVAKNPITFIGSFNSRVGIRIEIAILILLRGFDADSSNSAKNTVAGELRSRDLLSLKITGLVHQLAGFINIHCYIFVLLAVQIQYRISFHMESNKCSWAASQQDSLGFKILAESKSIQNHCTMSF